MLKEKERDMMNFLLTKGEKGRNKRKEESRMIWRGEEKRKKIEERSSLMPGSQETGGSQ